MFFTDPLLNIPRRRQPPEAARGTPSVPVRTAPAVLLSCLLLAGCADVRLPEIVFDDGPVPGAAPAPGQDNPTAVLTGERPIRRADPDRARWPSLADVPQRPTPFSTPVERQALLDRLRADRLEATTAGQALMAPAAPPSASVPEPRVPPAPPPVPMPVTR